CARRMVTTGYYFDYW
nr:immunoglobulin heavy chain junction region [Mus musculus]MBK4186087.1 immunoglobulin heavy chain junction region [Mus musculus]MBK4186088.1 immunoglobulin heavy chain junction region [Mus musculus]MBK4186090.1 immunoglobulin heavy chain junction region [Mus musculus]MBK4186092.1 immunoglobulin heavy chain junction region [Mus musculus]